MEHHTGFDFESNTLYFRPIIPLREGTTYAVVITNRLIDSRGFPVKSPFPSVNIPDQTEDLKPLLDILPKYGLSPDAIAFAWVFTTGNQTIDLRIIREGLYGHGPLSFLAEEFPVSGIYPAPLLEKTDGDLSIYIIKADFVWDIIKTIIDGIIPLKKKQKQAFGADFLLIDYFVAGYFDSPNFLVDKDGTGTQHYPSDDDESFGVVPETGKPFYGKGKVTFICSVPKETDRFTPPF